MVDQLTHNDVQPPGTTRRTLVAAVSLAAVLVLLIAAVIVGGVEIHSQSNKLASSRKTIATLQLGAAASSKTTTASLKAQQSQLAALQAQLGSTQNHLKADEQQLKLTEAQLPPDLTKLATSVSASVVLINCGDELGSGFVLDLPAEPGYASVVVTAEHVIDGCTAAAPTPAALTVNHEGQVVASHLRAADPDSDVAIIDIGPKLPALQAAPAPVTGEFTMAVGNPLGLTNNVTEGNVSKVDAGDFLNTAPISNGNSGGPLVDRSGRVLGIADAGTTAGDADEPVVENLNFALRLNSLCASLLSGAVCSTLH
jgi:S1-C subfamily serine protease